MSIQSPSVALPPTPANPTRDRLIMPTVDRLTDSLVLRRDRWRSWILTAAFVVVGFLIRLVNIAQPERLEFDETYYAKDAWSLLHFGYERAWPDDADSQIVAGNTDIWQANASFIVHPQLGKWLIAGGEQLFGMNSFGWRFASLVFGSLLIGLVIRFARRLSRSTLVGCLAGLFITVDGLSFVMSRIALLDIFQAFFTVAAAAAWLADRDHFRLRLARYLTDRGQLNLGGSYGPLLLFRPWLLASGVLFGLACGCKWNSMYVMAAFGILTLFTSYQARRTAGAGRRAWFSLLRDGLSAFVHIVVVAIPVYVLTWISWLTSEGGYDRQWGASHPNDPVVQLLGKPLGSLWQYHKEIYGFHTGDWIAQQTHTYQAHPLGWPVIGRVIGIDAVNDIKPGTDGCTAVNDTCLRVVSGIGTPILWWLAALAVIIALFLWLGRRETRFAVPIIAAGATWLGWFPNADRPTFYFYAIMMIPFTATVLAMMLGKVLGPADAPRHRRRIGAIIVTAVTVLIIANFMFIHPILTDQLLTRQQWLMRMWFRSWI